MCHTQVIKMESLNLSKSVRQALNSTCKNQAFTEEQWRTFLTKINYIVNSRPLYPSSNNIWECPPVTPNDLLIGQHSAPHQPPPEDRVNPRHLLRSTENRVRGFWNCWLKYFAPNLLPRNKWFRKRENVKIGDLVLELDPKLRRCQWKMAFVIDTYPGNDGLVRKVKIKTDVGEYDRPIHKLSDCYQGRTKRRRRVKIMTLFVSSNEDIGKNNPYNN